MSIFISHEKYLLRLIRQNMSAGHRDCRGWGTCFVTGREYFINIFIFLFLETSGYEQQKQDEKNQRKPVEAFAKFILTDIFFLLIFIFIL